MRTESTSAAPADSTDLVPMPQSSALARLGPIDVAFALLHGPFGEDGTIQGLFEMMGTRYVGAGVLASAVGMDKNFMKLVLAASGLPVGPFVSILPRRVGARPRRLPGGRRRPALPVFVKPARGGSSLGITRVDRGRRARGRHRGRAARSTPRSSSRRASSAPASWSAGCWPTSTASPPAASQVAEIRVHTASGFYDFEAKYLPEEQVDLDVPADVDAALADEVRRLAVRTFEAIGCEGLARVDVFVTRERRVVVNEINTMPGFTPHSMFPRMWAASGLAYPELVDRLIQLALRRPVGLR